MKIIMVVEVLLLFFGGALLGLTDTPHNLLSFILGGFVSTLNFIVLWIAWYLIIYRKKYLTGLSLILVKYFLLISLIYILVSSDWTSLKWFLLGFSTIILACLGFGFSYFFKKEKSISME